MTEPSPQESELSAEEAADTAADTRAILIIFGTLVLMAVHFISGFTFDF